MKILHLAENIYTGTACGACDKYEVWVSIIENSGDFFWTFLSRYRVIFISLSILEKTEMKIFYPFSRRKKRMKYDTKFHKKNSREKWKNFFFTLHFLIVQNPLDRRTLISLPLFFRKVLLHWFSLYIDIKFRSFRLKEEQYLFVPHIFAPNQEVESVFCLLPLWKWGKTSASQQHQKILRKVSKFEPLFVFSSFTFMMLFMMKTMMMLMRG